MNSNQQPVSTPAPTAANTYPPFPENPYRHETDWDIAPDKYEVNCTDYEISEKHTRLKYGTTEPEEVDFVTFLFEITTGPHKGKKIASNLMAVSMFRKSNLYGFLRCWLGRSPETEFQPQPFVGMTAIITVESVSGKKSPDISFARITGIAPGKDTDADSEGKPA